MYNSSASMLLVLTADDDDDGLYLLLGVFVFINFVVVVVSRHFDSFINK